MYRFVAQQQQAIPYRCTIYRVVSVRSVKCVVRRFRRLRTSQCVLTQTWIVQYSLLHAQAIWYGLLLLGYKPVHHVTVLNTVGNCNTMVLYYNIMSGNRIPVGRNFPPFQTGPGAHSASCTMGSGSFPGVKYGRGVLLTTHPLLVLRSWKTRAVPVPNLRATTGPVTGTLYTFTLHTQAIWYRLLLLGYKPVHNVTVLNTVGSCNIIVSIIIQSDTKKRELLKNPTKN